MPTMADELKLDSLFCLFKGEPGTRKSTAALSFPKPQYWFSHDKKMNNLLTPMSKWGVNKSDIHYDSYNDFAKMQQKVQQLKLNPHPYKTIVLDSLTSCVDSILWQTKREKAGITRQSGQQAGIKIAGIQVNEQEDFNAEDSALAEIVREFKDIHEYFRINIIIIAHVLITYSKENSKTVVSRTIITAGKKACLKIPAYCEEVYHFNIASSIEADKEGAYEIMTRHTGQDFANTSLPLPLRIPFGDEQLYNGWIKPAIEKQKQQFEEYKQTQPATTNTIEVK